MNEVARLGEQPRHVVLASTGTFMGTETTAVDGSIESREARGVGSRALRRAGLAAAATVALGFAAQVVPLRSYNHCTERWYFAQWPTWLILTAMVIAAGIARNATAGPAAATPEIASRLGHSAQLFAVVFALGTVAWTWAHSDEIPNSDWHEHGCASSFTGES